MRTLQGQPDLAGSIIVLTHARTGSSLLMQTLRLLGANIVGDFARPDLPQSANPRGYYEDRRLLRQGLHASALAADPGLLRGCAVKLALRPLVNRQSPAEWTALSRSDAVLLVPIRTPAESLLSRQVFLRSDDEGARAALFHWSARNRLLDFGFLSTRICAPEFARPTPICIDYRWAIDNPADYVARVATAAGLQPSAAQRAAATANIDQGLYHVRVDDERSAGRVANAVRPLERLYEILRADDPDKWSRLRDSLPPWVREAGNVPPGDAST